MATPPELGKVKELLSNGKTEEAANLLLAVAKDAGEVYYTSALMLKNQLEQLQQDVIDGIVSDSDERLNWAKISRRIIDLSKQIEKGEGPKEESELLLDRQKTKPFAFFTKWVFWVLPIVLAGTLLLIPNLINRGHITKSNNSKAEMAVVPQMDEQKITIRGKLINHGNLEPVSGAVLDFNNGAFTATTGTDGTFVISFDKALNGKKNIPLIIRYKGKKMVEEVWLNEDNLKSLIWGEE